MYDGFFSPARVGEEGWGADGEDGGHGETHAGTSGGTRRAAQWYAVQHLERLS